jgi:hypothetical protein
MKHKHHDTGSERSQKIDPHHCSVSAKGIAQLDEPEAALVYSLFELDAPIKVTGVLHGQYPGLLRIFEAGGFPRNFEREPNLWIL